MPETPYLSIVVTTRNDDHGGSLLRRTQTFLNALVGQIQRHAVSCELIVVEWNPPQDRPRLREALRWPAGMPPDRVRIIEVPCAIHSRYRNAEELPLYQMIAKNAGVRRARGEFILATNIDILFSDELMAFLAARQLEPDCLYRIDRHDVMTDVPMDAPVEEQLAYCKTHLVRINSRAGSFPVTSEGLPARAPADIADSGADIAFGEGWFPPEFDGARPFRWVANDAEMAISVPTGGLRTLLFEIAPGPSMDSRTFGLEFVDAGGRMLAQAQIEGRSKVALQLPPGGDRFRFRLHTPQGGRPLRRDPRILNFRVLRCEWQQAAAMHLPAGPTAAEQEYLSGFRSDSHPIGRFHRVSGFAGKIAGILRRAAEDGPVVTVWVPVPRAARSFLRFCFRLPPENNRAGDLAEGVQGAPAAPPGSADLGPVYLHTNGCGDFTLMHRSQWFALRGYAEWDLYSFHIDSVLCYAAYHGGLREVVLPEPMRIYHIEHGRGSGWSPEGERQLFERLRRKGVAWLDYDEVITWAVQMRRLGCPMIFNLENWGLGEFDLPESGAPASAL